METIAVVLILLHDPDGRAILLNPSSINSMRSDTVRKNELLHDRVRCMIATSDGKLVNVTETCDEVRLLIREDAK